MTIYNGILMQDPEHRLALRQLGMLAVDLGDYQNAIAVLRQAIALQPTDPDLYHAIGTALRLMGHDEDALMAWQGALRVDPTYGPALHDSALLLQKRGELARAGDLFQRLAAAHADHFEAVFNRAVVLYKEDNLLAAERWFHQASRLKPDDPRPLINLAMIYRVWGFPDRAVACLDHAITIDPERIEAHWNLANVLLLSGDYARGFAAYEWRFRRAGFAERSYPMPRWRGESLDGATIFLATEQGLGDVLQFVRFAKPLADQGAKVIVECLPGLERMIATAPGVHATAKWGEVPKADYVLPLLSLPHMLATTLATLPNETPYLGVPPGTPVPALDRPGFKVGIAWRGNPHHENDRYRSIALEALAPLRAVPGVAWYSLQIGPGEGETQSSSWAGQIKVLTPLKDFSVTAAIMAELDLVISVDTAVAHLAGALARPVWMLIPRGNDWRWLADRNDSPWYPTMRLFRQHHPRDWAPTIAAMAAALGDAVAQGRA